MEILGKIFFVVFVNISVFGLLAIFLVIFSSMFDDYLKSAYSKSAAKYRWQDKEQNLFQKIFLTKQLDKVDKFQYFVFILFIISYVIFGLLINVAIIVGKLYFGDLFKILIVIILLTYFFAISKKRISSHKIRRNRK
jgi:hypothetical protein